MNMKMEIIYETGYLHIKISGKFSLTEANDNFVKIMNAAEQSGVNRLLIDCLNLEGAMNTSERLQYSSFVVKQVDEFSTKGVPRGIRLSYVVLPPLADPGRFGETFAVNRGVNVRIFDTIDEAINWLEIEPADKEL